MYGQADCSVCGGSIGAKVEKGGTRPGLRGARSRAPKVIAGQEGNCRKTTGTNAMMGSCGSCLSFRGFLGVTQITRLHDKNLHILSHLVSPKREVFKGKTRVAQDTLKPQAEQVTDVSSPCP